MVAEFEDARLLYERAQHHIKEFHHVEQNGPPQKVWTLRLRRDHGGNYQCSIVFCRETLRQMKPIAADAASNLIHALDHVASACARLNGAKRNYSLYYPLDDKDDKFEAKLAKRVEPLVGAEPAAIFAGLRTKHRQSSFYRQMLAIKELSNVSKHWRLSAATTHLHAISVNVPGGQQMHFTPPKGHFDTHDEFMFWDKPEPLPSNGVQMLLGLTFDGLEIEGNITPWTAFEHSSRAVLDVIEAVEGHYSN